MTRTIGAGLALLAAAVGGHATPAAAQFDGAHVYWAMPINTNIIGVTAVHGTINAAWTNFQRVEPSIRIDNSVYLLSYSRSLGLFGRSAVITALLPAGAIATDAALPPGAPVGSDFAHGVADPSLGFWINVIGAPRLRVKDFVRYEQRTTIALQVNGTFPVGQYDPESILNVGANQWKVRFGLPIVQSIGAWVPGRRFTLEILPTALIVSDNPDALGETVAQDPTFGVETHLTRDITKRAFLSLDYSFLRLGGATYTDNATGTVTRSAAGASTHVLGATAGYEINDNLRLFVSHFQTIADNVAAVELQGALLKVMLSWSWHSVLEKVRQIQE